MKRAFTLTILLSFFLLSISYAQTLVTPGDGTLSAAIAAAKSGDVLQLMPGNEYTDANYTFGAIKDKSITIETADPTQAMPVVHLTYTPGTNSASAQYFLMDDKGSLTLDGIEFTGESVLNSGTKVERDLISYVVPASGTMEAGNLIIKNCLIHHFTSDIVDGAASNVTAAVTQDTIKIINCIVHDAGMNPSTGTSGSVVQFKYANCNYFEAVNCTFYNINAYGIRFMGYPPTYPPTGLIDHCTFNYVGGGKPFVDVEQPQKPWVVSNSIFSNIQSVSQKNVYIKNASSSDSIRGTLNNLSLFQNGSANEAGINDFRFVHISKIDTASDPGFTDTSTVFVLPANSPLRTFATDGGPIGDPRWNKKPTAVKEQNAVPKVFSLNQNYPNPFNPATTIKFSLDRNGMTNLTVYDILGRRVAALLHQNLSAGEHEVNFSADNLPSGVYIYKLDTESRSLVRKMMLMK